MPCKPGGGGVNDIVKKLSGMNYFVALIILLVIILILGLIAFILVASFPGALGTAPPQYEIKEVYDFEPWSFKINSLVASFPEGGMIIPVFRDDKQEAALLIGPGEYADPEHSLPAEKPLGLYLNLDFNIFSELRGDIIFMPTEDAAARKAALEVYQRQPGLPFHWQSGIPLVFHPGKGGLYYYFIDAEGNAHMPPVIVEPGYKLYGTLALYALLMVMALLIVFIFSLDYHPSRYWKFIHCARPPWPVAAAAAGTAAFALLSELLPALTGLQETIAAGGYAAAIIILIVLARLKQIDFLDFGIRPDTFKHGYLMALVVAVLYLVMTRGIPGKPALNGITTLIDFLQLFFLVALARELIWRGYIQTALGRILGTTPGIIITAALTGLIHYIVLAATAPWMLAYPYTAVETFILVPGTALVLGLVYLRTENILSSTLLHSLILFLPRIMAN